MTISTAFPFASHYVENTTGNPADGLETAEFDARVQANQRGLAAELQPSYDFIVCGSGSSGSVVARRLAETGRASVLLLEAGGTDNVPNVREVGQWLANLRNGTGLGISGRTQSIAQRAPAVALDGKGARRRFEHQWDGMVARTQE
jgi:choline dehydrogenase-like flavoprotein